jgi:surface antigen
MSRITTPLAFALITAATAASAQWIPGLPGRPSLTPDDITHQQAAIARLYEGRPAGAVEHWRSSQSGDSGTVKLVRSFVAHGMPCRRIHYTLRYSGAPNSPISFSHNWCRLSDGKWKIFELSELK